MRFHDFDPSTTRIRFEARRCRLFDFRCPPGHPRWSRVDRAAGDVLVFPRDSVRLDVARLGVVVADPTAVLFMPRDQTYRRECLAKTGDRCDGVELSADFLAELADELEWPASRRAPPRAGVVPVSGPPWLLQREIRDASSRGATAETVEGLVLELIAEVVADRRQTARRQSGMVSPLQRRRIDALRAEFARRVGEPWALTDMARHVGVSPARLCRMFRRRTGTTIHAYRESLRLRAALGRLEGDEPDLTALALDLGYASHAHFTARFGRHFGRPPSAVRTRLGAGARADRYRTSDPHGPTRAFRGWPKAVRPPNGPRRP